MHRRTFLQGASAVSLASVLARPLHAIPAASPYLKNIGLQLWTVRNQMEDSVSQTLKAVADAGYKQVELMDVEKGADIAKTARDLGMDVTSSFFDWQVICKPGLFVSSQDKVVEAAKDMGLKHLVFGYIGKGSRETKAQYQRWAERANALGEKCQTAGIQLCYHHHSFEFGKLAGSNETGFDILVREFDTKLAKFEIDVFWVAIGGRDPLKVLQQLDGRVSQVHLKDLLAGTPVIHDESKVPNDAFREVGQGTIDFPSILETAKQIGVQQCHVEQDQSPDPIASIGTSLAYLTKG